MKEQLKEIERLRQEVSELRREKTERKRAGERIQHLNLVLRGIRNVNQLIAREKDRSRLLKGICDSLTESHGYYNAWVALLDESGRLIAHAESGLGADFLPMKERLVRGELPHCAQKALKQSGPVIIENPPLNCSDCPLSAKYSGRGGMAIGLQRNGKSYGILSISVPADLVGDEEECLFFQEVAGDIAFALHNLELEERHAQSEHDVKERVKELECLYGIAAIAEKSEITPDELYQEVANLLPSSWQYPEICCARITIEDREFRTANYRDAKWKLCSDIKAGRVKAGAAEVNYLEERPELDEGPFSREERRLIDAVAERMGRIAERKKTQAEIVTEKKKFEDYVEGMADGLCVNDTNGTITQVNEAFIRMFGYTSPEQVIGKTIFENIAQRDIPRVTKRFTETVKNKAAGIKDFEVICLRTDGSEFFVSFNIRNLWESKKYVGSISTARDITERKWAEAQIRELSSVVEQSIDGIAIANLEPKLTYVNDAFARMHGYSPAEMVGMRHTNLHSEEQTDEFEKAIEQIKTKGSWTGEIGHVRKDGTPFPTHMSVTLLTDAEGKPTGITVVCRDITERKKHEKEYKQLIDGMNDTIFVIDFKGKFLDVNDTAIKTLGYSRTELLTMGPVDIDPYLRPDDIGKLIEGMKLDERQVFESQHRTKDGKIIPVEISSSPVSYQGKAAILSVARDITERKKVEEALRKSEKQASAAIEAARGFTFSYDIATGKIIWGGTIEAITGYTPEEFAQVDIEGWAERIHPEDRDEVLSILQEATETLDRATAEYRFRNKDGSYVVLASTSITEKENGKPVRLVGILQDISERKWAEEALREGRERYNQLVNGITDVFFAFDKDLKYTHWNAASEKLTKISAKDALGKSLYDLFPNTPQTRVAEKKYREVLRTGQPQIFVNEYKLGGKDYYFEISAYPLKDGISVFTKDITERKKAEETLKESEERYRNLFETATDGIFTMDSQTRFTSGNRKAEEMCGYSKDELIGEYATLILPEEEIPRMADALKKVLKGETDTYETRIITKNGALIPVEVTSSPMEIDGKIIGTMGMARDITERKRAEEALQEAKTRFEDLFESANELIITTDAEGWVLRLNKEVEKLSGYSKKELIGQSTLKIAYPEDNAKYIQFWQDILSGLSPHYELRTISKTGIVSNLLASGNAISKDGNIVEIQYNAKDITAEKQAEEELRKKDSAIAGSINAIAMSDLEGKLTYVNTSFIKMWGYDNDGEILGRPATEFWQTGEQAAEVIQALFGKGSWQGELVALKKDGSTVDVQLSASMVADDAGNPICLMSSFIDITARKRAEQTLRESEEKYRDLVENINDAIYATDRDGNVTYASPVIEWLTGYSPSEITGRSVAEFLDEEDLPSAMEDFKRVLSGHSTEGEYRLHTKSGEIRWMGTSNRAIFEGDSVVGAQGMLTDITNRKLAEQASEEARTRFEDLFETANELIITTDTEGWILHVNKEVERFSGYSKKELIGQSILKIAYPEDVPKYIQFWKDILDGLTPRYHLRGFSKTGNISHLLASASVVKKDGKIIEIQYNAKDITDEKQAEEKLRESEGKYRAILENIEDGYFEVDLAGNLAFFNDAMCQILGYTRDEMMGMNNRQYMDKENAREVFQTFNKVYTTGKPDSGFDWQFIRKDGTKRFVETSVSLIRDSEGKPTGFRGILRDITTRKEMEAERKMLEQRAQLTSRLSIVGEMASGIVHEINNPLTSVIGFAQLLAQQDLPEDAREYARIINNEGQRVASIAGRILDFARHEKPERVYVDINQLIESTLELQAYEMEAGNIKVTTQLDPHLPRTTADVGQLQQVFLNIILNAKTEMQSAHDKGKLLVKTEAIDNTIRISFKDDGPGIARENLEKIFEPFFTTKEVGTATGLGLSICHEIIANHSGQIYAESTLGKGATFTIELPVVARQRKTATTAGANANTVWR